MELVESPPRAAQEELEDSTATATTAARTSTELPFLVTHWLANFPTDTSHTTTTTATNNNNDDTTNSRQEALQRIQRAASELAAAFHTLGAYGTTARVRFSFLIVAAVWQCAIVYRECLTHCLFPFFYMDSPPCGTSARGRRCGPQESICLEEEQAAAAPVAYSALQLPLILQKKDETATPNGFASHHTSSNNNNQTTQLALGSKFQAAQTESAVATRRFLDLRAQHQQVRAQMQSIQTSLAFQQQALHDLSRQRNHVQHNHPTTTTTTIAGDTNTRDAVQKMTAFDDISHGEQNSHRVTAQLQRQLVTLQSTEASLATRVVAAESTSKVRFGQCRTVVGAYRDPLYAMKRGLTQTLVNRPLGLERLPMAHGLCGTHNNLAHSMRATKKGLVLGRLRHAATINTHLAYPIDCLRFDGTGRSFMTGADDYLSRVFCLGSAASPQTKSGGAATRLDPTSYLRGAVLVCTLRGHAGVINDISVSTDNAFLATASEYGDCEQTQQNERHVGHGEEEQSPPHDPSKGRRLRRDYHARDPSFARDQPPCSEIPGS